MFLFLSGFLSSLRGLLSHSQQICEADSASGGPQILGRVSRILSQNYSQQLPALQCQSIFGGKIPNLFSGHWKGPPTSILESQRCLKYRFFLMELNFIFQLSHFLFSSLYPQNTHSLNNLNTMCTLPKKLKTRHPPPTQFLFLRDKKTAFLLHIRRPVRKSAQSEN